jgi:hypothetical protein
MTDSALRIALRLGSVVAIVAWDVAAGPRADSYQGPTGEESPRRARGAAL